MSSTNDKWGSFLERFLDLDPEDQAILLLANNATSVYDLKDMIVRSYENSLMNITEYVIHKHLEIVVPPIFVVLGTFGNLLSFMILLRKPMIRVSTYVFLAVLSLVDTIFLYLGLFRIWLRNVAGVDPITWHDWSCKTLTFLGFTTSDLSVWLIVAVTCERYIAVCYPLKASTFCNVRRAKISIGVITVLFALINVHFFWTVKIETYTELGEDVTHCEGATFWPWIDGVIYSFLPFMVISVLNILIIRQVVQARRTRAVIQATQGTQQTSDSGYKITVMLLTISFAFLICTLPKSLCMIFGALYKNIEDPKEISRYVLAGTITEYMMYFNHSMNFFLYCATGQKFRYELIRLIRNLSGKSKRGEGNFLRGYTSERTGSTVNNGTSIRDHQALVEMKGPATEALLVNNRV